MQKMMGKEMKNEFIDNLGKAAQSLRKLVTNSNTQGFILLGVEKEINGKTKLTLQIVGSNKELIKPLAEFMNNPETKLLFKEALIEKLIRDVKVSKTKNNKTN